MTFSIAARCARTGQLGIAIGSSSPAVAARCSRVRAGVGAACSQNITDPRLGPAVLERLAAGCTAQVALSEVVAAAPHADYRQLTVVDADGRAAAYSGAHTLGCHAAVTARDAVAAGNLLASTAVPQAMLDAFARDSQAELGDRLVAALHAAVAAGGEEGPIHSSGLLIAGTEEWPLTDLRVDWDDDPVGRIATAWQVWKPQAAQYVARALDPGAAPSFGVPGDR